MDLLRGLCVMQRIDWIALNMLPGLGSLARRRALERWSDHGEIDHRVPAAELARVCGGRKVPGGIQSLRLFGPINPNAHPSPLDTAAPARRRLRLARRGSLVVEVAQPEPCVEPSVTIRAVAMLNEPPSSVVVALCVSQERKGSGWFIV